MKHYDRLLFIDQMPKRNQSYPVAFQQFWKNNMFRRKGKKQTKRTLMSAIVYVGVIALNLLAILSKTRFTDKSLDCFWHIDRHRDLRYYIK